MSRSMEALTEAVSGAVCSKKRLIILIAMCALIAAAAPAPALAGTSSGSHPKTPSAEVLAMGSGYAIASRAVRIRVRALQRRLARAGYTPGPVDGRYGPLTTRAVERFQDARGLTVDGIAGEATQSALTSPVPVLHRGAGYEQRGGSRSVRALQRRLVRSGSDPGPIDGRYGPLTTQAVVHFQRAHGLRVDGIVGRHTWHALRLAGLHRAIARHHQRRPAPPVDVPQVEHVPRPAAEHRRVPELPVTLVLIGLLALGLATMGSSYARTQTRVRRARATTLAAKHEGGKQ